MKQIDVQQQPRMGVARTFSLTINGIRYRLFRSAVTVGVIAVAIAFMMNVLAASLVKSTVAVRTRERTTHVRKASFWAARLTSPGTIVEIIEAVASTEVGDSYYNEAQEFGQIDDGAMVTYHAQARMASTYLTFFAELDYATRKRLLPKSGSDVDLIQIIDSLGVKAALDDFWSRLGDTRSVRFDPTLPELQDFLEIWGDVKKTTADIRAGRKAAVAKVTGELKGRKIIVALADAEGTFGAVCRKAGFALASEEAAIVASQARDEIDAEKLEETVSYPEARKLIAARLDILPVEVNIGVVWDLLANRGEADWYFTELKKLEARDAADESQDRKFTMPKLFGVTDHASMVERARDLAKKRFAKLDMARAERNSQDVGGGLFGMGERMTWLLIASMVVCVVGVTNAMLMSVTERFREIATLKCLGAMDDFIMLMFVFEAGLLGLAGGIAGAVAGGLIGVVRMFAVFGFYLIDLIPLGTLTLAIVASVIIGMLLAAVGAVYPSFKAARLAPMEAMRIS